MTRPPMQFTKQETAAIRAAFVAVEYLASTTNWTDSPQWRDAYKLVRKDSESQIEAQGRIVNAWHEGVQAVITGAPMRHFPHSHAQHYVLAYVLGIRHAIERSDTSTYCGKHYGEALALCPAAIAAYDTAQSRWLNRE